MAEPRKSKELGRPTDLLHASLTSIYQPTVVAMSVKDAGGTELVLG